MVKYSSIYESEYRLNEFNVNIFIGMRGMGKTFSALSPLYDDVRAYDDKFMIARLTKDEIQLVTSEAGNMFKDINAKKKDKEPLASFGMKSGIYGVYKYDLDEQEGKMIPHGLPLAYVAGMPTLRKACGGGMSDVSQFIVDEFIPVGLQYRGDKFRDIMYAWESINRNREDEGKTPCKLILLSNANNIYDSILRGFNLVRIAERMCMVGENHYFDETRRIALHIMKPSESYREFKQKSAVALALQGTEYYDSAYENKFSYNDFSGIVEKSVKGWKPVCSISGKAFIYTCGKKYHVTYRRAEVPDYDTKMPYLRRAFKIDFGYLDTALVNDKITYQSYELKEMFLTSLL